MYKLSSEYSFKLRNLVQKINKGKMEQKLLELQTLMETTKKEHEIEKLKKDQVVNRKMFLMFKLLGILSIMMIVILLKFR